MKTARISLLICAAAILAFACSTGLAQQADTSKQRHTSASWLYAPGHSSHVSGDLYSSILVRYMRDPSRFDLVAARWSNVGFVAPRLSPNTQLAAHRIDADSVDTPAIFQAASFALSESGWGNTFGSFDTVAVEEMRVLPPSGDIACAGVSISCGSTPEPSTWFAAALALGVVGYSQRGRLFRLSRR